MSTDVATSGRFSIVCISPQAWNAELPTNRQQIMRRAAQRGHSVVFVESGSFLWRDLGRIVRHPVSELRKRLVGESAEPLVRVRNALNVVPWGKRYEIAKNVNMRLTAWVLRRSVRSLPHPVVLWLYDPCAAPMIGALDEAFAVYDCVDDYAEQYAPDGRRMALVARSDRHAGRACRLVFATTEELVERHLRDNPRTFLVPNGGDYAHFSAAADRSIAAPELHGLPRPVLGFSGNLVPEKVDFALLRTIAVERPDWTLVLVGPARGEATQAVAELTELENVVWLGWKPYDELPRYVAAFDVGLCPYVESAYTRNVFPLKVYEYLAAGLPVVATGVPSVAGLTPDVTLTVGPRSVIKAVETSLMTLDPIARARRMSVAARNTWDTRAQRLIELVTAELPELGPPARVAPSTAGPLSA